MPRITLHMFRFSRQGPVVTNPNVMPPGTFPQAPWDLVLDCGDEIYFNGLSALLTQTPSPEACENQINSGSVQANYFFSGLRDGMQFCLHGISGNLIYLKLTFVSDATFTTTWSATAWTVPSGN